MASTCCGHTGLCDTVLFIFLCILNISSDFKMPVFSFLETYILGGNPRWLSGKESTCQYRRCRRRGFDLWVRKIRWRRKWQPTPVFLPGKFPWTEEPGRLQSMGLQESDMTQPLNHHQTRAKYNEQESEGMFQMSSYRTEVKFILF